MNSALRCGERRRCKAEQNEQIHSWVESPSRWGNLRRIGEWFIYNLRKCRLHYWQMNVMSQEGGKWFTTIISVQRAPKVKKSWSGKNIVGRNIFIGMHKWFYDRMRTSSRVTSSSWQFASPLVVSSIQSQYCLTSVKAPLNVNILIQTVTLTRDNFAAIDAVLCGTERCDTDLWNNRSLLAAETVPGTIFHHSIALWAVLHYHPAIVINSLIVAGKTTTFDVPRAHELAQIIFLLLHSSIGSELDHRRLKT